MADQVDVAIPAATIDDSNRADWTVDCVGSSYVVAIGRPGASAEVCSQGRGDEGCDNGSFEHEIVDLIVRGGIRSGGGEAEDLDGAVIARSGKVLVRRVECDSLDMALMVWESLQLLEGVT